MSTIFALSSGALPSAIAVMRLSGPLSEKCLRELTHRKVLDPRKLFYTKIYDKRREVLDTAMAAFLPGPSTFTGEDTAELFVHGSRAVVDGLARRLTEFDGVRHAHRGEFTKRAFFNGKMGITEARGLNDLINAETDRQRKLAQRHMGAGPAARELRNALADAVGRATLLIDFGEHVDSTIEDVRVRAASILSQVRTLSRLAKGAEIVQRGMRVVLIGKPNSGKSSILNRLAERDVAIVSETAGTTRDTIEVRVSLRGVPVTLCDTAGLRETEDPIEKEGIKRTRQKIQDADFVVAVVDSREIQKAIEDILSEVEEFDFPLIIAANKADLIDVVESVTVPLRVHSVVSSVAVRDDGVDELIREMERVIDAICPEESGPLLTEYALLSEAENEVESAVAQLDAALMAQHLQNALDIFGEICGTTVTETILDRLFSQFCIGK